MFKHVFNLPLSEGTIGNMLNRLGEKAQPVYDEIHNAIEKSKTVGADESGVKVNGKKFWAWVWQNVMLTFIAITDNRGAKTINKFFPAGFYNAILISDRWKPQLNTYAEGYQLCIAHLLRDLNYLIELEKTAWAKNLKTLFKKAIELKRIFPEYNRSDSRIIELEEEMEKLLTFQLLKNKTPKTLTFQNAMQNNRNALFTFLYFKDVPPDNNGSERAVRNIKVKQKISGQFKTGQDTFAKLRSIIDTCLKSKVPVMQAMKMISQINIAAE